MLRLNFFEGLNFFRKIGMGRLLWGRKFLLYFRRNWRVLNCHLEIKVFFQSSLFPLICFVDRFCIRVWNLCDAGSLSYSETLLVNEATKFASLIVAQQDVLLYHFMLPVMGSFDYYTDESMIELFNILYFINHNQYTTQYFRWDDISQIFL